VLWIFTEHSLVPKLFGKPYLTKQALRKPHLTKLPFLLFSSAVTLAPPIITLTDVG